ncbi:reverse transcriptase domain-containing protein [Tanacetum coccineum]
MLQCCKDTHLVLNWEKCHFMVKEGIVLGHKVSSVGLEVDKAKIDIISKLPPPTNIKGIRSFLGHASFYRRFIKDFSKIARPLTKLLEKDTPFEFDDECQRAFESLKEKLTCAPVIVSPNWNLPFELMCDASDFAVGVVLGQKDGEHSSISQNLIEVPYHFWSNIDLEAQVAATLASAGAESVYFCYL